MAAETKDDFHMREELYLHLIIILTSFLVLVSCIFFNPDSAFASGNTEKVIIIVVDGLRSPEGMDDNWVGAPADTAVGIYQYVPMLGERAQKYGTLFTNFYNNAVTVTTPAHDLMFSGVTEWAPNIGSSYGVSSYKYKIRSLRPTIFEMFRISHQLPPRKVRAVVNKVNTESINYSYDSILGDWMGAKIMSLTDEEDDASVVDTALVWMRDFSPDLLLIHMGRVDYEGHFHREDYDTQWHKYIEAVYRADSLVCNVILRELKSPKSSYYGKTTVLILTDHGRHDFGEHMGYDPLEEEGEFHTHGGFCRGCRTLFLLAIGPDIEENKIDDTPHDLRDIAPTVAYLLDFNMPEAEGRIISEMFKPSMILPQDPIFRDSPRIACLNGNIHLVWTRKHDTEPKSDVWYSRIPVQNINSPVEVDESDGEKISEDLLACGKPADHYSPYLAVDNTFSRSTVAVIWQSLASIADSTDNHADISLRISSDGDAADMEWASQITVIESELEEYDISVFYRCTPPVIYYFPAVAISDSTKVSAVLTRQRSQDSQLYCRESDDGGETWARDIRITSGPFISDGYMGGFCQKTDVATRDDSLFAVWMDCRPRGGDPVRYGNWNILSGAGEFNVDNEWHVLEDLSDTTAMLQSLYPTTAVSELHKNIAWTQESAAGEWRIVNRHSSNAGFEPAEEISDAGSLMPDMVAVDNSTFYIVFSSFNMQYMAYNVAYSTSMDGGDNWSNPSWISPGRFNQLMPQVALARLSGKVLAVWKEYSESSDPFENPDSWQIIVSLVPAD